MVAPLLLHRTANCDLTGRTVVFLHAHPDDEAIFTGATMRRLASRGARVVLITATAGEEGVPLVPLPRGQTLRAVRVAELEQACTELGVARLVLLNYRDSGMVGAPANEHPQAFVRHSGRAVLRLAELLAAEEADALVYYDSGGIYGHPDHLSVHQLGQGASRLARVTGYEATIAREALPAQRRHLVQQAALPDSSATLGRPTARINTVIRATPLELHSKRQAMAAHRSQIAPQALNTRSFTSTYATEWFIRTGAPGILDLLDTQATRPAA